MSTINSIVAPQDKIGISKINGQEIRICGSQVAKEAIQEFAKYGTISFSKDQPFKSSYFAYSFFKPVAKLRELYNLGDEILILCCSNTLQQFKSRTKDFIDYLLGSNTEYKNRLDKVTCFLLDECEDIQRIITEDRRQNPDARLIVPFSYSEISNGLSEEMLLNRLRSFLYERDLFGVASPLNSNSTFFGKDRTNSISELYGRYRQGEHGGVFGLRRIGKTSILNLLKQRVQQDNGVAVYFDMSMLHHQRWNSLLHSIIKRIEDEYAFSSLDADYLQLPKDFSLPEGASRYNEPKAPASFGEDMKMLYRALGNRPILLIFDEIEQIGFTTSPTEHWKAGNDALYFWQVIRAVYQMNSELFSFVIAGVNPKCIEISTINGIDNPIFNMLSSLYISLFDIGDIKEMLTSIGGHIGLSFEEEVFAKMIDDFGGHPFLTRKVCSMINSEILKDGEERPFKVTKYRYSSRSEQFQSELESVIQQILSVLEEYYPDEYCLLKKLALDGSDAFKRELRRGDHSVAHLIGYHLIKKEENNYYFQIKAVESYIRDVYRYDRVLQSLDEKWAQVSVRRNTIEEKLRNLIQVQLRSGFGKKSKERLIELAAKSSKDENQIKRMNSKGTLEEAIKELYLLQLGTIISKDWDKYEKIFNDKTKFNMYLGIINDFRIDAHAKDLDEENQAMLNYAFKFFEEALEIR